MTDDVRDLLLNENLRLATEVDLLAADLKYKEEIISMMARLLSHHNVPVPTDELGMLAKKQEERLYNIVHMSDAVRQFQAKLLGMRTGESSAGKRTGEVTEEDVNRILSDIDPDIVKKMGE